MMRNKRVRTHLNPKSIRQFNKKHILEIIRVRGMISQVNICRFSNMGSSTVSEIVNELKREALVKDVGTEESIGGRRAVLMEVNPEAKYVIGADFDVSEMTIAIMDLLGKIKKKLKISLEPSKECEAILSKFDQALEELLIEYHVERSKILGIGVSFHGVVDEKGTLIFSESFGWRNVSLKSIFEERWGIPTHIDGISHVRAMGEYFFGAGKGAENMIYVNVGDGVGAGIVMGGEIYRGIHHSAGEIGHNTIVKNGPMCDCGKRGCMEAFASGRAIITRIEDGIRQGRSTVLSQHLNHEENSLVVERIFDAARAGDEFASEIIRETGYYLGLGVANVVNNLDPEMIILGGYVIEKGGTNLLELIRSAAQEEVVDGASRKIKIEQSVLGEDVGVVGGAALVYQNMFSIRGKHSD